MARRLRGSVAVCQRTYEATSARTSFTLDNQRGPRNWRRFGAEVETAQDEGDPQEEAKAVIESSDLPESQQAGDLEGSAAMRIIPVVKRPA